MTSRVVSLGLCALGAGVALFMGGNKAIGLVVVAAIGALLATRGWVRRLMSIAMAALGVTLALGGSMIAGPLVTIGGVLAYWTSPKWPVMGSRYERAPKADMWTAIDRGEDPTE